MHGEIGASVGEGRLELLDEEPLAADLVEPHLEQLVALRRERE